MRNLLLLSTLLFLAIDGQSQYAPRDNWTGSTAISKDSGIFVNWGTGVTLSRGPMDIRNPALGLTSAGTAEMTLGMPDGQVVSLGDGGSVILSFYPPIVNGPGADFAVFENGFHIRNGSDSDFLELAFVEVSSDGLRWVRFASLSDNDTINQLGTYAGSKASKVHNLAGKYVGTYGCPFDLEELKDSLGIDLHSIQYVRILDVVGSLDDAYASRDSRGFKINDPFPTDFFQGGFDLDAIGVIHNQHAPDGIKELGTFVPYPNPSQVGQGILLYDGQDPIVWKIFSFSGVLLESGNSPVAGKNLAQGTYFIVMEQGPLLRYHKLIIQ